MRAALGAGLCLLTAINCGSSPTAPATSVVAVPALYPVPALSARYVLSVTSSPSCDKGTPFTGTFDFDLVLKFPTGSFLVQPSGPTINGANSGALQMMILPGLPVGGAMLTGAGLAADGEHIVGFGLSLTVPLEGYAFLFPTTGAPPNEMTGDLQGTISISASRFSAAAVCISANHKYKLTPKS